MGKFPPSCRGSIVNGSDFSLVDNQVSNSFDIGPIMLAADANFPIGSLPNNQQGSAQAGGSGKKYKRSPTP